jgi:hypothetical protein
MEGTRRKKGRHPKEAVMLLYKYRSFERFERLLDILINERLHCPEYRNLNDPFEGVFYSLIKPNALERASSPFKSFSVEQTIDNLTFTEERRVVSLSATSSDVRMWSLYGSDHKGVAIEIAVPDDTPGLFPVTYRDELIRTAVGLLGPLTTDILSHKTHHWSYEREYRIITKSEWHSVAGQISRVLVGPRASDSNVELLEKIVGHRFPIHRMKLDARALAVVES